MDILRQKRVFGAAAALLGAGAVSVWAVDPIDNRQASTAVTYTVISDGYYAGGISMTAKPNADPFESLANGAALVSAGEHDLYFKISTLYGDLGPGTFKRPNLNGAVPIGTGGGPSLTYRVLGEQVGTAAVTLATQNRPIEAGGGSAGGQAFTNMQPSLALNYAIATYGYYPINEGGGGSGDSILGSMANPFIGQIFLTAAGGSLPSGFETADGGLRLVVINAALASLLGTTYGGDGSTTFGLPDLRGRAVLGSGGSSPLGEKLGAESTTLSTANLPPPSGTAQSFSNQQPTLTLNYLICANGGLTPNYGTAGSMGAEDVYLGQIITVAFNSVPSGWYRCEGQLLFIAANPDLYSVIGTTYGGDGVTTFALPDMRDRVAMGFSSAFFDPIPTGTELGMDQISLLALQIPAAIPEPGAVGTATAALLALAVVLRRRNPTRA
jgi:microcystin-dependent protein